MHLDQTRSPKVFSRACRRVSQEFRVHGKAFIAELSNFLCAFENAFFAYRNEAQA
jgi:hypothetical protein